MEKPETIQDTCDFKRFTSSTLQKQIEPLHIYKVEYIYTAKQSYFLIPGPLICDFFLLEMEL